MDNLITATQYAQAHGLSDRTVRHKAQAGQFKTATKKGKTWYIDKAEPFPEVDGRRTTGAYVDWRQKHSRRTAELQKSATRVEPLRTMEDLDDPRTTEDLEDVVTTELLEPIVTTEALRIMEPLEGVGTTEDSE